MSNLLTNSSSSLNGITDVSLLYSYIQTLEMQNLRRNQQRITLQSQLEQVKRQAIQHGAYIQAIIQQKEYFKKQFNRVFHQNKRLEEFAQRLAAQKRQIQYKLSNEQVQIHKLKQIIENIKKENENKSIVNLEQTNFRSTQPSPSSRLRTESSYEMALQLDEKIELKMQELSKQILVKHKSEIQKIMNNHKFQVDSLKSSLAKLEQIKEQRQKLNEQLENKYRQNRKLEKYIQELEQQNNKIKVSLQQLQAKNNQFQTENLELKKTPKTIDIAKLSEYQQQITKLSKQNKKLANQLLLQQQQYQQKMQEATQQIERLQLQLEQSKHTILQPNIEQSNTEQYKKLQASHKKKDIQINLLKQRIQKLETDLKSVRRQYENFKNQQQNLLNLEDINQIDNTDRSDKEKFKEEIISYKELIKQLNRILKNSTLEIQNLLSQKDQLNRRIDRLQRLKKISYHNEQIIPAQSRYISSNRKYKKNITFQLNNLKNTNNNRSQLSLMNQEDMHKIDMQIRSSKQTNILAQFDDEKNQSFKEKRVASSFRSKKKKYSQQRSQEAFPKSEFSIEVGARDKKKKIESQFNFHLQTQRVQMSHYNLDGNNKSKGYKNSLFNTAQIQTPMKNVSVNETKQLSKSQRSITKNTILKSYEDYKQNIIR